MKKNSIVLSLLIVFSLLLTGCTIKMEVGVNIDKDKNVTMSSLTAMDNEFIDAMLQMQEMSEESEEADETSEEFEESEEYVENEETTVEGTEETGEESEEELDSKTYSEEERWEYVESSFSGDDEVAYEGFTKTKYEEGEFKGYRFEKELGNLDDLTLKGDSNSVSYDELTKESKIFTKKGDVYTLKIDIQDADEIESLKENEENGVDIVAEMTVTLPQPAESNNATTVSEDGLTYTWDLINTTTVELSFKIPGDSGTGVLPWVILAVIVVAVIVFIASKGKKPEAQA